MAGWSPPGNPWGNSDPVGVLFKAKLQALLRHLEEGGENSLKTRELRVPRMGHLSDRSLGVCACVCARTCGISIPESEQITNSERKERIFRGFLCD